ADGIITVDEGGVVRSLNPAAARMFGAQPREVIGQPIAALLPEFDRGDRGAAAGRPWPGAPGRGQPVEPRELTGRRVDGTTFPVEIGLGEVLIAGARKLVCAVRDISRRRQKDEQLRESLLRFQQIADRIEDVFYIAEASTGRGLYVSPAFQRIFGLQGPPEGAQRDPRAWLARVHPEDR